MYFLKLAQKCVPVRTCPGHVPDMSGTCPQNVPVLTILGHLQIGRVQLRLQRHTHSTTGNKNISLWNTKAAQNLGSAWCWCLVYWVLPRPLPLPQDIRPGYLGRKNFPHCFLFPLWLFSPRKQSPGWHIPLHPWSENLTPTPLTKHSTTTCWV